MVTEQKSPLGRVGDFEVVRELGRGGMGVVYEARQISLNRRVALKVVSGGLGLTPRAIARFKREAEAAAKLHHTNIVPIYATGEEDGAHYYAMELIEGPSLDKVIRQMRAGPLERLAPASDAGGADSQSETIAESAKNRPAVFQAAKQVGESTSSLGEGNTYFDTVARLVAEVADALAHAHAAGVIHRDIKPSNLLLSPTQRLSISDFGLARMLEEPGMTMSGEFVGSPLYMSPEQIAAGRMKLDARTDIYSLGATLYELLTLHPPFQGESRDQIIGQIISKEPKAPRAVNRKVPVDLETICLKAMEKDPDRRYQRADEMAEDLRRFVSRFAISARRVGPVGRAVKWTRRHPAVAAALSACLVLAVCAAAFAEQARRSQRELLAQKREQSFETAFAAAMSGDLEATEGAIKQAELAGVSVGQVRMLRGLLEFQNGQLNRSIEELRQAVKLLPESIPARSLLAVTLNHSWHWREYVAEAEKIDQLTPVSAEDHLFKGYALSFLDAARAVKSLDQAIRLRDTPMARALRVEARTMAAHDAEFGPAEAAQISLDAAVALENLPNHPFVLFVNLWSKVTVADLYHRLGEVGRRDEILRQAKEHAGKLEGFVHMTDAAFGLWTYWNYQGEHRKGIEKLAPALERTGAPSHVYMLGHLYLQQGETQRVREILGKVELPDNPAFVVLNAISAADLARDPGAGMEIFHAGMTDKKGRRETLLVVPLILGDFEAARVRAEKLLTMPPDRETSPRAGGDDRLRFVAGQISAEELLRRPVEGNVERMFAHCLMGAALLGRGEREQARTHFRQAVERPAFGHSVHDISWAILNRLENDPAWPEWRR